jgi:hypothetical protein
LLGLRGESVVCWCCQVFVSNYYLKL